MTAIADADLIMQLQQGDRRAFAQLYERHKDGIYAYCFRMLLDAPAAEDAAQDTFLKMHDAIGTLRNADSFRPWLYRIARNEVYMHVRRRAPIRLEDDSEIRDEEDDPHRLLVSREEQSLVRETLLRLKPEYREVLLLCEYDGLRYAEIALVTGSTESAVKARIFKARRLLTQRLRAHYS